MARFCSFIASLSLLATAVTTPVVALADAPPESSQVAQLDEVERELSDSLELSVLESGPYLPWTIRVTNKGQRHISVATDPRLLWFEATVPGKKKTQDCRIPDEMRPKRAEEQSLVTLAPGELYELRIDPRFYCFEEGDQSLLVPGTHLTPHLGWPENVKKVWRKGKLVELRQEQSAPFVAKLAEAPPPEPPGPPPLGKQAAAKLAEAEDADDSSNEPTDAQEATPEDSSETAETDATIGTPDSSLTEFERKQGLKQIAGRGLALSPRYIAWASTKLDNEKGDKAPLSLEVTRGSDSREARDARVTVKLTNRGKTSKTVFARREHLTFLLLGPDGIVTCPAPDEERAPDGQAFTRLSPGKSISLVTRILEFCDNEYLDRPGFYLVAAEMDLTDDGSAVGVDAYAGKLFSTKLRPVRVRTGELPFRHEEAPTLEQARKELAAWSAARKAGARAGSAEIGSFPRKGKRAKGAGGAPAAAPPAPTQQAPVAPTPPPSATRNKATRPSH